ncbi:tRNA lysidine(34) synthetase TilS [Gryllotalpicola protaetiae]|uniref:tRNA(Ile)-lysidine synthase n=1 Tax=Gryllotalpicola protaetiae TaxID=2419771 RepID=A0A387BQ75_9MICO|nr:tRNA lysidine(34) synthetase TilS [Gryllotalpicola protaetiae]AYG03126.1 tRNA lysidine(34) synthetase TilS [Gryllotalpicola protaetiae]
MTSEPDERRPRLTPAIADVRRAVRASIDGLTDALVLVAVSGGADSLALAAATAFEAPRAGLRAGAVVVDHGLQDASAEVAARAADQARELGLDPVQVVRVAVDEESAAGPEAAARTARYAALAAAASDLSASAVLLAHTLDDQAETVLLGLARGSGAASLQGMAAESGIYRRPLLGIRRAVTRAFCADSRLEPWNDPQNLDPSYARVRVRERVLPVLERELGPGVSEALARTAEQLREDNDAFLQMIDETIEDIVEHVEAGIGVAVSALEANPAALRGRIVRFVAQSEFGVALERVHVQAVLRLVTDWHGQQPLDLPGFSAAREGGLLVFRASE